MKRVFILLVFVFAMLVSSGQTKHLIGSTEVTSRIVKDSLDIPWEITWGADNHIWVTERFGRVSRINPSTGEQNVLLDISSDVYERSEAGMLGMVLHPEFDINPHVFIAYTYLSGSIISERLVKFSYDGTLLAPIDTLIEGIKGNTTHIGSRLIILPDNTLLMSTGDAQDQALPQNKNSVVGKILRMNLDGSVPSDNPNANSYVWSFGHRNAQGMCRAPNGKIYSSEHGPTTDDELNILSADRNYGWPTVAGFCDTPPENTFCAANNVYEPLAAWTPTIAPSDIIWYAHDAIPEFKDKLLMTVLKDKSLVSFGFNSSGDVVVSQDKFFKDSFGRLRDICVSPEGKIYLATNGNSWSNSNPFTHSIIELSNESFYTSISNKLNEVNVKVGPNPVEEGESIYITIPEAEEARVSINDVLGRPVINSIIYHSRTIEMTVKPGIYFWKVELFDGDKKEGKLIVQ